MKSLFRFLLSGACASTLALTGQAQQIDEPYNQKIKEFTTDPRFLPSSVLDLVNDPKMVKEYVDLANGLLAKSIPGPQLYSLYRKLPIHLI